jgi:hypothetical protein
MNSNFDGVNGMYGAVQFVALAELGRLWSKKGKTRTGPQGSSWKRVVLVLAIVVTPVALLLASGNGF